MYNMDISIFGYKLNIQVLILIGLLYLILVVHTICGCSDRNFTETFSVSSGKSTKDSSGNSELPSGSVVDIKRDMPGPLPAGDSVLNKRKGVTSGKEGFVGTNINYSKPAQFDLNSDDAIDTSKWSAQDMTIVPGKPMSPGVKEFLAREPQPVPLPEGEMLMFATTPFKPECCPNTYSNSTGCACMTGAQFNWLMERGGNNVPYSEF